MEGERRVWIELGPYGAGVYMVKVEDAGASPWQYWAGASLDEAYKQAASAMGRAIVIPVK